MSILTGVDAQAYGRLLARLQPGAIQDEIEYERLYAELNALQEREGTLEPEEEKLFELLAVLVQDYEQRHHELEASAPHERLQFLLEQRSLKQADIWHLFGSRGLTSSVVNGHRAISKEMAKKLAAFFDVSPALFL